MKKITDKIKDPKTKAILKSYLRAVLASAITMAMALSADLDPKYAVLVGSIAAPLAKWADKAEKEFGLVAKKKK